jgi:hypothetical protein
MEKRKQYIEETAERETIRLFNNSLLHPEFKYGFILGMTHADKVPFIKNHKVYDTISKDVIDRACEWLSIYYPNIDRVGIDKFVAEFKHAMEEE